MSQSSPRSARCTNTACPSIRATPSPSEVYPSTRARYTLFFSSTAQNSNLLMILLMASANADSDLLSRPLLRRMRPMSISPICTSF